MNVTSILIFLISSIVLGCTDTSSNLSTEIGEGIEIYLTKSAKANDYNIDYDKLRLDTFTLQDIPVLKYGDIIKYNPSSHTMTLRFSSDNLEVDIRSVYGSMFIVTLDKKPIYCGFFWPLISSATCSHVFILENWPDPDGKFSKKIIFNFSNISSQDPRNDARIIERLKKDGKLIN
jgi:hypothetical protein